MYNLRKKIQVALNSCQPNSNRVDKIEKISNDFALDFANWYRIKCIISNYDIIMSVEDAFKIYNKESEVNNGRG